MRIRPPDESFVRGFIYVHADAYHRSGGDFVKKAKLWGAAVVLAAILMRPETAVAAAQRAMRLWCTSVAPALFPFLVLMPMLTGRDACAAYDRMLSRIMGPAFGLPGSAAPAVVMGMISGSPGGALAVRRVAGETGMRRADAMRIAFTFSGAGPAYLIMGVGQGLYGSVKLGLQLAGIQIIVQLALLILLRGAFDDAEGVVEPDQQAQSGSPIPAAVENLLGVCGYMVIFSVIAGVAAGFIGEHLGGALLLITDLPSGLAQMAGWEGSGRMLVQGAAIGFGGLCIMAQNLDAMRAMKIRWQEYLAVRCIASAMFACLCALTLRAQQATEQITMGNPGKVYAFSLLIASAAMVPGMIFLSKKLFLNKRD